MWSTAELVGAAFPLAEVSGVLGAQFQSGREEPGRQTRSDQSWLLSVPACSGAGTGKEALGNASSLT